MISFFSTSTRMLNSKRAMEECIESAFGEGQPTDCPPNISIPIITDLTSHIPLVCFVVTPFF